MSYLESPVTLAIFCIAFDVIVQANADIFFRTYSGSTIFNYTDIPANNSAAIANYIDFDKQTVVFIHGFLASCDTEAAIIITSAYQTVGNYNVICVDWRELASIATAYIGAVGNTHIVAQPIVVAIDTLHLLGMDSLQPHLVGHSLGAHVAGFAGRQFAQKLERITGLDPAGPLCYCDPLPCDHILSSDATEVYIIHTDQKFYGAPIPTWGTHNFYPNGGTRYQPGCPETPLLELITGSSDILQITDDPTLACSHFMAYRFWAEAVVNDTSQYAIQCDSWRQFVNGNCDGNQVTNVGEVVPDNLPVGNYYYVTNGQYPYGLGEAGTIPTPARTNFPIGAVAT